MLIYSGAHDQAVCIGLVTVCMMMSCIGFESCQVCCMRVAACGGFSTLFSVLVFRWLWALVYHRRVNGTTGGV